MIIDLAIAVHRKRDRIDSGPGLAMDAHGVLRPTWPRNADETTLICILQRLLIFRIQEATGPPRGTKET